MRRPLIIAASIAVAAAAAAVALFALLADESPLSIDLESWRVGYDDESWGA